MNDKAMDDNVTDENRSVDLSKDESFREFVAASIKASAAEYHEYRAKLDDPREKTPEELAALEKQGEALAEFEDFLEQLAAASLKQSMVDQVMEAKAKADRSKERILDTVVHMVAGGGLIEIRADGAGNVLSLEIDPSLLTPDSKGMLEETMVFLYNSMRGECEKVMKREFDNASGEPLDSWEGENVKKWIADKKARDAAQS